MKKHINWFHDIETITTDSGKYIKIIELVVEDDETVLKDWAKHFREHYCSDDDLDKVRGTLTRKEYLEQIKFPDSCYPGSLIRSGDFSEILASDYIQYLHQYIIPRTRYDRKVKKNSSTMGSDIIGYKIIKPNIQSDKDELLVTESKGNASDTKRKENVLQEAIDHSNKDVERLAESLNAMCQRLFDKGLNEEATIIQRFFNKVDSPYITKYAAVAVLSNSVYAKEDYLSIDTSKHTVPDLLLFIIKSEKLMMFIHKLYERAAIC